MRMQYEGIERRRRLQGDTKPESICVRTRLKASGPYSANMGAVQSFRRIEDEYCMVKKTHLARWSRSMRGACNRSADRRQDSRVTQLKKVRKNTGYAVGRRDAPTQCVELGISLGNKSEIQGRRAQQAFTKKITELNFLTLKAEEFAGNWPERKNLVWFCQCGGARPPWRTLPNMHRQAKRPQRHY